MGKCKIVSTSVSLPVEKGNMLANTAPAAKGTANQTRLTLSDPRFHTK